MENFSHKIFNKQLQELVASSIKFKEKDTPKQYKERFIAH